MREALDDDSRTQSGCVSVSLSYRKHETGIIETEGIGQSSLF